MITWPGTGPEEIIGRETDCVAIIRSVERSLTGSRCYHRIKKTIQRLSRELLMRPEHKDQFGEQAGLGCSLDAVDKGCGMVWKGRCYACNLQPIRGQTPNKNQPCVLSMSSLPYAHDLQVVMLVSFVEAPNPQSNNLEV